MDKDIVVITGNHEKNEERARQLIGRTLAPLRPEIDIIAVKISQDDVLPLVTYNYHCTILLKIEGGAIIRAEARDCDDILAVYRALAKIVDQIPLRDAGESNNLIGRVN